MWFSLSEWFCSDICNSQFKYGFNKKIMSFDFEILYITNIDFASIKYFDFMYDFLYENFRIIL